MKVIIWLTLSVVTDITIAGVLVQFLRGHRTGIPQTEDILSKIIKCEYHLTCNIDALKLMQSSLFAIVTIQTGLVTSVCAMANLIIYLSLVSYGSCNTH